MRCTMTPCHAIVNSPVGQLQRQRYAYGCALMLMLVNYMERYRVGFGRSVGISARLKLNVSLLCIRCTLTLTHLHTRLLFKHTTTAMTHGSARIFAEYKYCVYMERYPVDFGRTGSTLVLVHVWIRMYHCFVYDALCHHRNCTLACHSTTMAMPYDSAPMLIEYMELCRVGFGRTGSTLV